MRFFRIAWRLPVLVFVFGGAMLLLAICRGFARGDRTRRRALEDRILRRGSRIVAAVIGMSVHQEGPTPRGAFLLVSNHLSYLDITALMSVLDARFLSRADVAGWPLLGWVTRYVGTIYVDRSRRGDLPRVIAEIERALSEEHGVVFFPEGTSSAGAEVLPFKPSLFQVPAAGGFPVSCGAIRYRTPPGTTEAQWSICWWGGMAFGGHFLRMLGLPGFDAFLSFSDRRVRDADRKRLAEQAREEVLRVFTPTCDAAAATDEQAPGRREQG